MKVERKNRRRKDPGVVGPRPGATTKIPLSEAMAGALEPAAGLAAAPAAPESDYTVDPADGVKHLTLVVEKSPCAASQVVEASGKLTDWCTDMRGGGFQPPCPKSRAGCPILQSGLAAMPSLIPFCGVGRALRGVALDAHYAIACMALQVLFGMMFTDCGNTYFCLLPKTIAA